MLLNLLNRKEKLKFLDLALHMINIDGKMTDAEEQLLSMFVAEVGDGIVKEYQYNLSKDLEETIKYFTDSALPVRNITYLNLLFLTMHEPFYNTSQHFFLEDLRKEFNIKETKKKQLMRLVYEQRDFLEKVKRSINE
ncbi:MAG: hypothetical protein GX312_02575 [Candidatus Phytoplasma sp.]|nr:hypothetical protein [Phytoplasma sp.]